MPVYADRPEDVNQGDIFDDVAFVDPPLRGPSRGMVISHDCDVDKFLHPAVPLQEAERAAWRVTVAVVHPLTELSGGRAGDVRGDRMPRYFYLPAEGGLPDLCVDLWTEQPVRMESLLDASSSRLASLSPETRERLWWKIIRLRLGQHYRQILEGNVPADAA